MQVRPVSETRICGDLVYTAGQIGVDGDGTVPPEFGRQVELAIESLASRLEEAGASLDSVVKVTNFVVNRQDVAEMNEIYGRYFSEPYPARSTIVCGLVAPEYLFEIEAVARRADA
jgi:2-iminobutanoate/2-iminopropanoate deaminase